MARRFCVPNEGGTTVSVISALTDAAPFLCSDNASGASCTSQSGCEVGYYCDHSGLCASGSGQTSGSCASDNTCDYGYYCNRSGSCVSGFGRYRRLHHR